FKFELQELKAKHETELVKLRKELKQMRAQSAQQDQGDELASLKTQVKALQEELAEASLKKVAGDAVPVNEA
ncbi:hypothetical protein CYMTET_53589, partial [Cymbomonas tetramitiformis]